VTSTKFRRLTRFHRLQITRESEILADLLRASENYVSRSYVEDLQKAGANLEIEDDGWTVVETTNANVEDVVERRL
jgi:hypothetical protein